MSFTKLHENRLIIDGEINEKHALLVECGQPQGISVIVKAFIIAHTFHKSLILKTVQRST